MEVDIHDPLVDAAEVRREFALEVCPEPRRGAYEVVVLAVAHRVFLELGSDGPACLGKAAALALRCLPRSASGCRRRRNLTARHRSKNHIIKKKQGQNSHMSYKMWIILRVEY